MSHHPPAGTAVPERQAPARSAVSWLLAPVVAAVVFTGLLLKNRLLLDVPLYELGDAAANSLLVNEAKDLTLLVGHYSRVGFNHPGPAVMYLQALGEWLFHDLFHLTPTPYNAQVLAVMVLHGLTLGAICDIAYSWCRRWAVPAVVLAVVVAWYSGFDFSLAGTWIPVLVVPPFLLLLVSAGSVAAGRVGHVWLLAASAGLLVHAHVVFAMIAPVVTVAALATWVATNRTTWRRAVTGRPRPWIAAGAIIGVFLAPIVLNTVLHWPGEIPKYLDFSQENQEVLRPSLLGALRFTGQFWTPTGSRGPTIAVLLTVVAAACAWWSPEPLRRFLLSVTGLVLLGQALLVLYARFGIDDLGQAYVGYFGWSLPAALLVVIAVAVTARLTGPVVVAGAAVAVAAVVTVLALRSDSFRVRPEYSHQYLSVLGPVREAIGREPVVIDVGRGIGPFIDGAALLLHLERDGTDVCVQNDDQGIALTRERLCTTDEESRGQRIVLREPGTERSPTVRSYSDITVQP